MKKIIFGPWAKSVQVKGIKRAEKNKTLRQRAFSVVLDEKIGSFD